MFSKNNKSSSSIGGEETVVSDPPRGTKSDSAKSGVPSIISADLTITGNLKSEGDIQVDGKVEGDIDTRTLTIGEGARVKGAITCDSVRVCGAVDGSLQAQSVVLAKTAKVIGDIMHDSLAIEAGAFIEGNIKRLDRGHSRSKDGKAADSASSSSSSTGSGLSSTTGTAAAFSGSAANA